MKDTGATVQLWEFIKFKIMEVFLMGKNIAEVDLGGHVIIDETLENKEDYLRFLNNNGYILIAWNHERN